MARFGIVVTLALLAVAGCDRSVGRLPDGGIAALEGTYVGDAVLTLGRPGCPQEIPYVMTVRNGIASGEARSPRDRTTVIGRFEGVIDAEGKIGTISRMSGNETVVEGFFDRNSFRGTTKSDDCTNRLSLTKRAGG
jgi:hypothetical protein